MGSHSKCRGGRGPGWPRLPPGQGSLPRLSGLRSPIYYYTPLSLNLANKQQQATSNKQQHVSVPFSLLLRPNASDHLPM